MRTEVKIGIVVGLIIVAGAVFFFVQQGRPSGRNVTDVLPVDAPAERATGAPARATPPRPAVTPAGTGEPRPALPLAQRPTGLGTPTAGPTTGAPSTPPAARPLTTGTSTYAPPRPAGPEVTTAAPTTQLAPSADLPPLVTASPPATSTPPSGSPISPPLTTARPESESPRPAAPGVALPPRGETPSATLIPPPPPTRGTPPPAAGGQKHTITENDSLWAIALKYYDDGSLWPRIKAANPGLDENRLLVGQTIVIPPKETTPPTAAGPAAGRPTETPREPSRTTPPTTPTTGTGTPSAARAVYVVEQGDSLISIARNVLGDGTRWREIYELNKSKIPNPDILYVGLKLQLPERNAPAAPPARPR